MSDMNKTILFDGTWECTKKNVIRILMSLGHQFNENPWIVNGSITSENQLIPCIVPTCGKLFLVTKSNQPNYFWKIGRFIVNEDDERVYRSICYTLINDAEYEMSTLKKMAKNDYRCSKYMNLL